MGKSIITKPKYLIDTSTWLFALKPSPQYKDIREEIYNLLKRDLVVISPFVILEILTGTRTEQEFNSLKDELSSLTQLFPDREIWETSAQAGFKLRRKGITIPLVDLLIAVTANTHGCILLHHDYHYLLLQSAGIFSFSARALPALPE
jgi:predicted nucleic acid-binding protein